MRVLLLGPYPPPHGGVQTNLTAIRGLLLRRRIPCAVINLHRFRSARDEAVYHPTSALALLWLLVRMHADIVHLHIGGAVPLRLAVLCLACTLKPGGKSVLTFHSGGYASSPEGKQARPRTLRGFVFRRFDRVIAVNPEIAALFARFGVAPERIRLIAPHALPSEAPAQPLPPALHDFFDTHKPILATVGLLEPEYDLPLQMEALGRVREHFPKAGLVIIGAGSLEAELRARLPENVQLAGDVPHAATLRAIAEADVFLRTTLYDGDSVAVREALHLGTPVIATDNRMRPEGVRLIPPSNLDALVRAIVEQLSAPRPHACPGDADANIEAVLKVYAELVQR